MKDWEHYGYPGARLFNEMDFFQNKGVCVDLEEDEERIFVTADLPGIPKEGIRIHLDGGERLIIEGHQSREMETKGRTYLQRERRQGRIIRTVQLPVQVDDTNIHASYQAGTLKISLPKSHQRKVQEIPIQ